MDEITKILEAAVAKKEAAKKEADFKAISDGVVKKIAESVEPGDVSKGIIDNLSKSIQPAIEQLLSRPQITAEDIAKAVSAVQISVPEMKMPEMKAPIVNIPAPIVNIPAPIVNIPETKFPSFPEFPSEMSIRGVTSKRPFPVIMMDQAGKPMQFPVASMGAGGGRADFFTIKDIQNSTGGSIIDNDGNVKIAGSFSVTASNSSTQVIDSSGNVVTVANPFPVQVVSGSSATSASNIVDSSGVAYSGSNPVPVTLVSGGSSTTGSQIVDSSGVGYSGSNPVPVTIGSIVGPIAPGDSASALRVVIAGDQASSVSVTSITGPIAQGDSASALRVVQAGDVAVSSSVISQTAFPIAQGDSATALRVLLAGDSVSSVVVNSGTITTVTAVTSITNSVAAAIVDSSGLAYSGSNPVPTTIVSGALTSTVAVGDLAARTTDTGGNPLKVGGVARSSNPTKYADGDRSNFSADLLGRQLVRPLQVRDLIATAYVTLSTGTEATLLAAGAGSYIDLISVILSNTSTTAVQVDLRAGTAGNIVQSFYVPANATTGWTPPIPWPQDATGNTWTVDMPDITNSNVLISALFSKEM